ncbi:MAG: hypothetical protein ACK5P6_09350, partial [Pseudobdellovibrionaceae bacterium]
MKTLSAVKQLLLLLVFLFQTETFASFNCKSLFTPPVFKSGAQILHEKNPTLHTSPLVTKAAQKSETGRISNKPVDKLNEWLNYLTQLSNKAESSPRTREQIKTIINNQYVIKENEIPDTYYAMQVQLARERGHGDIELTANIRQQLTDTIIADQKKSLDAWTEYLISKDTNMYPMWLKYWIFSGMTKLSKYNAAKGTFGNRDKGTVAPFAELNREALSLVVDQVLDYLKKGSIESIQDPELVKLLPGLSFSKLYGHTLLKLGVGKEGAFKTNLGNWVVYKKGSDPRPLVESLAGRNTGWCTAGESTAKSQLKDGDFHVYYSLDQDGNASIPRVAIRMENDDIAEVRGVGENQNLDSQINQSTVVSSKLKDFGSKGEMYN